MSDARLSDFQNVDLLWQLALGCKKHPAYRIHSKPLKRLRTDGTYGPPCRRCVFLWRIRSYLPGFQREALVHE
jgi:hypothetical protein